MNIMTKKSMGKHNFKYCCKPQNNKTNICVDYTDFMYNEQL